MNEIALAYLEQLSKSRRPKTHKTYALALKTFFELVGEDAPLTSQTYALFLRKASDMNASTQAIYRTAVRRLYKFYGIDHPVNLLELDNITEQLGKPRDADFPQFDRSAIEKFILYMDALKTDLPELRDRAFVITLADTGLRIGEACNLLRGSIDWVEFKANIRGKRNKLGVIRFSIRSIEALKDYLITRMSLDSAMGKPVNSLPLFARHDHKVKDQILPIHVSGIWQAVKQRMEEATIDPSTIRIHDFRHYFVTRAYEVNNDIKFAQTLARHSSMNTTSRYTHQDRKIDELYHQAFNEGDKDDPAEA